MNCVMTRIGQLWGLETKKGRVGRRTLRKIFMFSCWFFNDLKKKRSSELKIEEKNKPLVGFCCVWHQVCWVTVNVCENLQKGSTLPSRGNGCNVQIGLLQCECVKLCCFVKAHTSPSLVSTVRTRMLLFTWASGVLVSRLVSKGWRREHSVQFRHGTMLFSVQRHFSLPSSTVVYSAMNLKMQERPPKSEYPMLFIFQNWKYMRGNVGHFF